MPSIPTRLKQILSEKKLSQAELAIFGGVKPATVSRYLAGRQIDSDFVISLKDKLKVNPTWLLTGEGGMFLTSPQPSPKERELSDAGNGGKPDVSFDKRGNPIVKYPTAEINPILGELTADEIVLIQSHRKMKAEMEKKSKKSS